MNTEDPKIEDLYATGVVADIVRVLEMPDGTTTVILQGKKRFQLEELSAYDPYLIGKIKLLEDVMPDKSDREFEALVSTIKDLTIKMLGAASEPTPEIGFIMACILIVCPSILAVTYFERTKIMLL